MVCDTATDEGIRMQTSFNYTKQNQHGTASRSIQHLAIVGNSKGQGVHASCVYTEIGIWAYHIFHLSINLPILQLPPSWILLAITWNWNDP